jgi:hypothetical protein
MELVILAGATWRIAWMLTAEEGPFSVFAKLRHLAGIRYDEKSRVIPTTGLASVFNCVHCMSVWVAFGWAVAYIIWPQQAFLLALPFALSTAAILINRGVNG